MAQQLVNSESQQSQTWQQTILNSADFTIISTDLQGIIQTLNAGALRKLGYELEEVIGKVTPAIIHDGVVVSFGQWATLSCSIYWTYEL